MATLAASPAHALAGAVALADLVPRQVQATSADVAIAATVSFIDTSTNTTVATTLTDKVGAFSLTFPNFTVTPNAVYIVEAVKGLNNNAVGVSAARLRTLVSWNGSKWSYLSAVNLTLNVSTTALCIMQGTRADIQALSLMGSIMLSLPDNSISPPTSDTFYSPSPAITQADFHNVSDLVRKALAANGDPIGTITGTPGNYALVTGTQASTPVISAMIPSSGGVGAQVTLLGSQFSSILSQNAVTVNGVLATLKSATSTSLVFVVPNTTTGAVVVGNPSGTTTAGTFTIFPALQGTFPAN